MYILVDTDNMQVLAKHPNFQKLHELGILQCSESATVLPLEIESIYKEFDDVQVQMLYMKLTGALKGALYTRNIVSKILHYYLNALPETKIPGDVATKAQHAIDTDTVGETPSLPMRTFANPVIEASLVTSPAEPTNMGQQGAWTPAREAAVITAPRNSENATTPRASGTREVIFEVADQLWEAAGKPMDKSQILKLRKEMMDLLETKGVKRNTSSNTLGLWVKERIV